MSDNRPVPTMSAGEGPSPGEGGQAEGLIVSGTGRREMAQKEAGNPKEKQAEAERIARDEARHQRGFSVAGHGGRDEGPGRERTRSR